MEIEKLIEAIKLCGSTPSVYQCKQCAYWAGGDMSQCIPRMAADVADTLEQLQAENDRLKRERDDAIRQLKFFAPCAGCKWYRGIKGCAHELGCDNNHDYYEFVAKKE